MNNFNAYSKYYDLLYKDKNYEAECNYINSLIQTFNPNSNTLLELGCGSGSHAQFLSKQNINITGIERSSDMVNIALQKNIQGFTPIVGDISNFSLDQKFDTAISLFHVISYLTNNNDLIKCFINTHKHLSQNGIFIFDVWYSPAVYMQKPETRIKRMENDSIKVTRIAESTMHTDTNIVDVNFEVHIQNKQNGITEIINEKHPMRHFSIPEIELIALQTGFSIIRQEEFLTGNKPSEYTWGVCFVLQKQ
jgi:SAM-dependent methyltransferase